MFIHRASAAFVCALFFLAAPAKAVDATQATPLERDNRIAERTADKDFAEGERYAAAAELQKAREKYERALRAYRDLPDARKEALTLLRLGQVHSRAQEWQEAIPLFDRALILFRGAKDSGREVESLVGLMRAWRGEGHPAVAAFYGKRAVNLYGQLSKAKQDQGGEGTKDSAHFKSAFYTELADILISQGRLREAELCLSLLKEDADDNFSKREGRGADRQSNDALSAFPMNSGEERLSKLTDYYYDLSGGMLSELRDLSVRRLKTGGDARRISQLEQQLAEADGAFLKSFQSFTACCADPRPAEESPSRRLQSFLHRLDGRTVAVYVVVTERRYYSILITPALMKSYGYEINRADLNRKVLDFWRALQNPSVDPQPLAREMYDIIMGPMKRDFEALNAETVVWSLDGVLRNIPFNALHDGRMYMVERYRNVVFTLDTLNNLEAAPQSNQRALGLGVSKAWRGASPLPAVPEELHGIVRESPDEKEAGVFPGKVLLDESFTVEAMRDALRQHYSVVHLASHFFYDSERPENSTFLIGDGTRLTVARLRDESLLFEGVDLLTLAACNTGMGGSANGSEGESFAMLLQKLGAKAVLMSKWSVNDRSTGLLMRKFYQLWAGGKGMSKIEALRQAQLSLLKGDTNEGVNAQGQPSRPSRRGTEIVGTGNLQPFVPDERRPYAHPYYWAPFILIGNWR